MNVMAAIERPPSLTSMVVGRLRDSIIDGSIELGSLLSEKVLAEHFGTSKTPVREAIVQLQSLGLVEVLPQRGGVVFKPSMDQVRELCEVRIELEGAAFRLALEKNQATFAEALGEIAANMARVYDVKKPLAYQRLDNVFHECFFQHCGNALFAKAYGLFSPRICALRTQLSMPEPKLLERSLAEHKKLAGCAKKGDLATATEILTAHINRTREFHSRILAEAAPLSRAAASRKA